MPEGIKYEDLFKDLPPIILSKLDADLLKTEGVIKKRMESIANSAKEMLAGINTTLSGASAKKQEADTKWIKENTKAYAEYKQVLSDVQRLQKLTAKVDTTSPGSIARLNAEMNKNIELRRRMAVTDAASQREFKRLTDEIKRQDAALKQYDAQIGRHQRNVGNYRSALGGLVGSLKNVAAGYLSVYSAWNVLKNVFTTTKELNVLSQSYKYLIQDQNELAQTQGFLTDITKRYGLEIISTSQSYLKFRASIAGANFDLKESQKLFESVAKAGSILGLSSQRLELIFLALEQMISKGTISAEELRRQLGDNLPGAMQIMARALNVSVAELTKMLKANEVLASEALPKFRVELERAYGIESVQTVENLQTAINDLKNEWTKFVDSIKASDTFQKSLTKIGDYIRSWRFFMNPDEYLKTEGTALAQEGLKKVLDSLKDINDQEKIREALIKASQKAFSDQKDAAKEMEKYDKRFKGPDARAGYSYWAAQQEGAIKLQEEIKKLLINKEVFDATFFPPVPPPEPNIDETLEELDKKVREARGFVEYLEAVIQFNEYKIKISQNLNEIQFLEGQNAEYKKQIELLKEIVDYEEILVGYRKDTSDSIKDTIDSDAADIEAYFTELEKKLNDFVREEEKLELERERFYKKMGITRDEYYQKDLENLKYAVDTKLITEKEYLRRRVQVWLYYNRDLLRESEQFFSEFIGLVDNIYQGLVDKTEREINLYDEKVDALKSSLDEEKKLKDEGKANDYDRLVNQLANEQALREKAQKKYEIYQKRQAQLKFLETQSNLAVSVAEAFAANAGEGPVGWIVAIAAASALISAFVNMQNQIKSIGQYAEGTEYVDGPGTATSDSIHAKISKGERIVPAHINRKLDGIDNDRLPEIYSLYKYNMLRSSGLGETDSRVISELQKANDISSQMLSQLKKKATVTPMADGRLFIMYDDGRTQIVTLK